MESGDGAKASAMKFSIAETAKANNLNTYEYFEHLLTEMRGFFDIKYSWMRAYLTRIQLLEASAKSFFAAYFLTER